LALQRDCDVGTAILMFKKILCSVCLMAVLNVTLATVLEAQAVKVRDFQFGPKQGRNVLFGRAVTPSNDVLSIVASDTGTWEFYKVSDWLSETPVLKKLALPGYFSKKDEKDLELLSANVFATGDGAYAVCIGSAEWLKRVNGWAVGNAKSDDIISVVDLSKLSVVATTRTSDLDLFEFHEVKVDDEDYVRVDSLASGKPRRSAFIRLSIPFLPAGPRCSYEWITDSPGKQHPQPVTANTCQEALRMRPLDDYLGASKSLVTSKPGPCENSDAEFCRLPGEFAADGRLGVALRSEGHDNIFGSWVTTSDTLIVFSSAKRADVARIKEPTNDSFRTSLTFLDGRNYLLVIQGGTHLMVYELSD
jgi:hypothetical protein